MAPKRKSSTASPSTAGHTLEVKPPRTKSALNSNGGSRSGSSRDSTPRRSSRRLNGNSSTGINANTNGKDKPADHGAGLQPDAKAVEATSTSSSTNSAKRRKLEKQTSEGEDGVRQAMRELGEMEARLHDETRRQREAVERSHLVVTAPELPENVAFNPQLAKRRRRITELVAAEDRMDWGTLPMEGLEAMRAVEDVLSECMDISPGAEENPETVERGAKRPPPVNSGNLPLPWRGRLGYACLNTYLRAANPPIFSSRTCRIASIIEHRHPLAHPNEPEHATKNRPDKSQRARVELGQRYLQSLGLANARDIVPMLRWNAHYNIHFMRLSSEMFPFASHEEHGYTLAPFAADTLAAAGRVAAELNHRVTTHPGQFTQLGSPRAEVIAAAVRDLTYHDEMLALLRLPPQLDRDAVMILHMGGTYGDKEATIKRFKANYAKLSDGIKRRLVLENDDVAWSVHDLLPVCEEMNIPLVLDFHHHNIVFDASQLREGTTGIVPLFDRIVATWTRKGITPKMHYSEPCAGAVTPRERRKHSARVKTLPPCPNDMDLMIEAKDKEQAVFELMRAFKLPGYELVNDLVPHEREDESPATRPNGKAVNGGRRKGGGKKDRSNGPMDGEMDRGGAESDGASTKEVRAEEMHMGGPTNRVYWPEGFEDWLKPKKKEATKRKSTKLIDKED